MAEIEILLSHPTIWIWFVTILGLLVGSFLNVVIHRLPTMMEKQWTCECQALLNPDADTSEDNSPRYNLLVPPSSCPKCEHKIRPWENIPVISYLFLRGKCGNCKTPISIRYPIIELAAGLLALLSALAYGPGLVSFMVCVLSWMLLAMSMIDVDHQLLPDSMTLPLLWLGLLLNANSMFVPLEDAVYGAAAGYLSLWSVYWLFKLVTGKEGMGFGDFKLLAALGAWMGWQFLPLIILLSSMVGAVTGIAMIVIRGRDRNIPIPFGPYLAAAGLIAMFKGDELISSYLQMAIY
ncbi:prepilin peptidase [Sansalvadorimonas verongulae]|uniref:prepilin peptidase n=1 Tax=Sansalvadorimonas verongulae TaxID=2172824 RepID=UPI002E2F566E|nr:A24 family peptidase [Sansalvadorimonas verongulae]MTI15457.1 prepilin peptidase [Sansalvadorimonas verongulae]